MRSFSFFLSLSGSDAGLRSAPLHYPVPWASGPETSFVVTASEMCTVLGEQGFRAGSWIDSTEAGVSWFAQRESAPAKPQAAPGLGIQLVMGPDLGVMTGNLLRNLREGRAALVQTVWGKP